MLRPHPPGARSRVDQASPGAVTPRGTRPELLAARHGLLAAGRAALVAVVLALVAWLPDAAVGGHPGGVVRAGLIAFLGAHHGGYTVSGTRVGFVPLGALMLVLTIVWRAVTPLREVPGRRAAMVAGFAAGYGLAALAALPFATVGGSAPHAAGTVCAVLVLPAAVAWANLARSAGPRRSAPASWAARLSRIGRALDLAGSVRPAAAALLGYVALGGLLVAASLVAHAGSVERLSAAVGGGLAGTPVLLLELLTVPNAILAASSYAAGPGFSVGAHVAPLSAGHGLLPAVPLLGAVPGGRAPGAVLAMLVIAVVAVGIVPGMLAARRSSLLLGLRCAGVSAVLAGLAAAAFGWLAGGALGAGRLRSVGPSAWQFGSAVTVEVAVVAGGVVLTRALIRAWPWRASGSGPSPAQSVARPSEPELAQVG